MDQGLLLGITEGLRSGLTSYREESDRSYRRDMERKKFEQDQEQNAERLELMREQREFEKMKIGKKKDDDGNWVDDPESQYLRKAKMDEAKQMEAMKTESLRQGLLQAQMDTEKQRPGLLRAQAGAQVAKSAAGPNAKAPTADQSKSAEFAKMLDQSESVFGNLEKSGYNRADKKQGFLSTVAPDSLKGEDLLSQEQAERAFVNAVLRRESGASISPTEFKSAEKQYFPRVGDTPQILAQKKANRDQKRAALTAAGAQAYGLIPTVEVPRTKKQGGSQTKVWNGVTYKMVGDQWVAQ